MVFVPVVVPVVRRSGAGHPPPHRVCDCSRWHGYNTAQAQVAGTELLVIEGADAEKCSKKVPDLMVTLRGLFADFQTIVVLADGKEGAQPEFVRDTWASGKKYTPDRKPAFLSH